MGLRSEALQLYQPEKKLAFTPDEYRRRLSLVRQAMEEQRIDLLYCSLPSNLYYLSGYQNSWYSAEAPKGWPPLSGMAVKQDEDRFIFFDRDEEEILVRTYTIATDIRVSRLEANVSELEFVLKNLKDEGWLKGAVGIEKWSYRPNPAISRMFQEALEGEGCRVVDGSDIVGRIRAIKSPQEMAYTKTAAKIADIGMRAAIEHIRPGMTEIELRAEIDYACARAGGENPAQPTYVLAGQRSAHPHALASSAVIMPGDIVYIDLCGVRNRYHADIARTVSVGEPHPAVARQIELSAGAWPVLLGVVKPNCRAADVLRAMKGYYLEAGIWEDHWWVGGYELGIAFPPDWPELFFYEPETDPGSLTFPPGTVINYESDFYLPERAGVSPIMDTLAIEEKGTEILSRFPPDLIVVDA